MRNFKTLLIDLDDTLLPEWDIAFPIWDEVCAEAASATGLDAKTLSDALRQSCQDVVDGSSFCDMARDHFYDGYALLWDHIDYDGPPLTGLDAWLPEFRQLAWKATLASLKITDASHADAFAHRMWELGRERRVPYDDAFSTMEYLSERHTLVAVTNGVSGVQARKIESFGFGKRFDHIVLCGDYLSKPDPLPFNVAMELAESSPEECAMIGNSLSRDIAGARNAGIFSVWVNRNGEKADGDLKPDREVKSLEELRQIF